MLGRMKAAVEVIGDRGVGLPGTDTGHYLGHVGKKHQGQIQVLAFIEHLEILLLDRAGQQRDPQPSQLLERIQPGVGQAIDLAPGLDDRHFMEIQVGAPCTTGRHIGHQIQLALLQALEALLPLAVDPVNVPVGALGNRFEQDRKKTSRATGRVTINLGFILVQTDAQAEAGLGIADRGPDQGQRQSGQNDQDQAQAPVAAQARRSGMFFLTPSVPNIPISSFP